MAPRVLHVVRGMSNSSGTTHIVIFLTEELAKLGCDVSLYTVEKRGQGEPVFPDPDLVRSEELRLSLPFANPGVSFPFYHKIKRRVRDFDIIHIHAIWNFPTLTTMRAASQAGVPYLVAPQGSLDGWAMNYNAWRKGLYAKRIEGPWFSRAAAMQALTPNEREQIRRFGVESRVALIPNGVSESMLEENGADPVRFRKQWDIPADHKVILFLARLHAKKGLDNLAEAWGRIAGDFPKATLVVAGNDGGFGYEKAVRGFFEEQGVSGRTIFTGEVRGEDKRDAFAAADLYVLPSYSEGQPVSLIEAMSTGTAVVATPGCNMPDIEKHDAGLIAEADGESVAAAMRSLLQDDEDRKRRGRNARELVAKKYTWPRIARRTLGIYERILSGRKSR